MSEQNGSGYKAEVSLSRNLGLFSITMIGVGAMVGAGIFVLTGIAAGTAGPALILSFALNGIITVFTAMVYAELGAAIPEAGGGYLWVKEGLPGPNAFQAGWMSWFAHAVAGSLYALGFGSYLALVFGEFGLHLSWISDEWLHKGLAIIIILIFVGINFKGVSETGMAGNIVTILKVLILLIFIVSGIWTITQHPDYMDKFDNFAPEGWAGILNAMGLTFIAFEGYEIIVQAGEEVKNPKKNIPRAIFISLAIVVPIYMLVAFVAIGAVNPESGQATYQWLGSHGELGIAEAARQFMPLGTILLLIGGLLSTMSALNATTFSSTRVSFALGRDNKLPSFFGAISSKTKTPWIALLISGGLITSMAVAIPIKDVASAADIMFLLLFLQVNIAVITLRRKYGKRLNYSYLTPLFPAIPIIGIITKLFLAVFLFNYSAIAWYFTLGWLGVGFLLYYFYARPRQQEEEESPLVVKKEEKKNRFEPSKNYHILVPLIDENSINTLLYPAINAAKINDGKLLLLNVITVPEQLPLAAGRKYIEEHRSLIEDAMEIVQKEDMTGEVLVRIAHRPVDGIVDTANDYEVDLLVMGWYGRSSKKWVQIGKNVDEVLATVNCEVLVVEQNAKPPYKRILLPVVRPDQVKPALKKALLLSNSTDLHFEIFHVFSLDITEENKTKFIEQIEEALEEFREEHQDFTGEINIETPARKKIVKTIARESEDFDVVLIGGTQRSGLRSWFFEGKPSAIAKKAKPPVILVRPKGKAIPFGVSMIIDYITRGFRRINPFSAKKLQKEGMLAPEGEEKTKDLSSKVKRIPLILSGLLALGAVTTMYIGYGNLWTWIGSGAFIIALILFAYVSSVGVVKK